MTDKTEDNPMSGLEPMHDAKIATSHGVAAIALSLAMKYHDIATIQDGTLYQQYKLEGRNMTTLHIDMVFETAIRIERHLMESSDRIAALVVEAVVSGAEKELSDATQADDLQT